MSLQKSKSLEDYDVSEVLIETETSEVIKEEHEERKER